MATLSLLPEEAERAALGAERGRDLGRYLGRLDEDTRDGARLRGEVLQGVASRSS